MKIAVAGASGFIGNLLLEDPPKEFDWVGLGRSLQASLSQQRVKGEPSGQGVEWRVCDLFSLRQTEIALEGVDIGIYLVHSMLPRASLTQSTFEDCDLLLADNFGRAAQRAGVKRIIYLGGLAPEGDSISTHLRSRMEVETALGVGGIPVTTLRAGLILGAQGSSFQILYLLVKRLPVMICPSWTRTLTQCVAAKDVVELIRFCISDPRTVGKTFDIGSPEVLSYRQLMATLAEEMNVRRLFFSVPFFSPGLSRLWIQLITGASRNLVAPLVQSLKHEMIVRDQSLLLLYGRPMTKIREALRLCFGNVVPNLRSTTKQRVVQLRKDPEVRSIQRMPLPEGKNAAWMAQEYFSWLHQFLYPFIRVSKDLPQPQGTSIESSSSGVIAKSSDEDETWVFRFAFFKMPLLKLRYFSRRSTPDRQIFYICGGVLSKPEQSENARLEFREVLNRGASLAAIHEFKPALPWVIYKYTQAILHLWVMSSFRRHLQRIVRSEVLLK